MDVPPEKREDIGLQAVYKSVFPIKDFTGSASLEFVSYRFSEVKHSVEECIHRGMSYEIPLRITVRLVVYDIDSETGVSNIRDIKEQEIYFGTIPLMTEKGTFIINGTERVVVSQLHRSSGVFFDHDKGKTHSSGKIIYSSRIIPVRGSWIDMEIDPKDIVHIRIDRRRKFPVTILFKAFGYSVEDILSFFYKTEKIIFRGKSIYKQFNVELIKGQRVGKDIKDPETGWQNWGIYRWMAYSPNELRVFFHKTDFMPEGKHISQIFAKYEKEGQAMPACIVMGGDPTISIASAMNADRGVNEAEIASGLSLNPIQLIKAEESDLLVPADAEIVIDGEILPGRRASEGPFPEYTRLAPQTNQPVFKIKTITHRKKPVIPFAVEGSRVSDSMVLLSMIHSADLMKKSRAAFLETRWINFPVEGKMGLLIVSTKVPFSGYIRMFALHLFSSSKYKWFDRVLFVDTDVEPVDLGRCINDMTQKVHPIKDISFGPGNAPKNLVCAYPTPDGTTHRLSIDATWPAGTPKESLPVRTSFETSFTPEVQKKVIEMWNKELGFERRNRAGFVPES